MQVATVYSLVNSKCRRFAINSVSLSTQSSYLHISIESNHVKTLILSDILVQLATSFSSIPCDMASFCYLPAS